MAIEREIFENLQTTLAGISWAETVQYDKIRLSADEFREDEVPVLQFYMVQQLHTHVQGRLETEMEIAVELILRKNADNEVDLGELLDKKMDVEQAIGDNVQLNINGSMIHVSYISAETDLHLIEPFYIAIMTYSVKYYKPYTGIC